MKIAKRVVIGVALAVLVTVTPSAEAKKKKKVEFIERISARALSMGTIATAKAKYL